MSMVIIIGCGDNPVNTITTAEKVGDYERWDDYVQIKQDYVSQKYSTVIEKGPEFVHHYQETQEPEVDEIQYLIADSLFQLKRYDKAINEYRNLLENFPNSKYAPLSELGIGNCYMISSKYSFDEAISKYKEFLTDYPDNSYAALAQLNIGKSLYFMASDEIEFTDTVNNDGAIEELKKVLSKYQLALNNNIRREAELYIGKCYEEKPIPDYNMAILYYLEFASNNNDNNAGDIFYKIGYLYQTKFTGDEEAEAKAKEYYYTVINHFPYCSKYNEALNAYNQL